MDTQSSVGTRDLFILRALPNRGKSTLGEILAPGHCYASDDFFYELMKTHNKSYREVFDPELLYKAHNQCYLRVKSAMIVGVPRIAVANTNTTWKEMRKYRDLADLHGYRSFFITIERAHDGDNGHEVPQEALDRMLSRWEWVDPAFRQRFGGDP